MLFSLIASSSAGATALSDPGVAQDLQQVGPGVDPPLGGSTDGVEEVNASEPNKKAKNGKKDKSGKKGEKTKLALQARVIAGWEFERDRPHLEEVDGVIIDVDEFGFFLRQARVAGETTQREHIGRFVALEALTCASDPLVGDCSSAFASRG